MPAGKDHCQQSLPRIITTNQGEQLTADHGKEIARAEKRAVSAVP
jgi:hypothetical protein